MAIITPAKGVAPAVLEVALVVTGCSGLGAEGKQPGQPVTINQVPAAVDQTIVAQAAGANVREIDKVQSRGKPLYEAHLDANGTTR